MPPSSRRSRTGDPRDIAGIGRFGRFADAFSTPGSCARPGRALVGIRQPTVVSGGPRHGFRSCVWVHRSPCGLRHNLSVDDLQGNGSPPSTTSPSAINSTSATGRRLATHSNERASLHFKPLLPIWSELLAASWIGCCLCSARPREWPTRKWETPTAVGWSAALLALETSRARVFNAELRTMADELRTVAGDYVWSDGPAVAEERGRPHEPLLRRLNDSVNQVLPALY